jgi:hypothetical protein
MTKKQNIELNEIELERADYLINSDKLIFETLDKIIGDESGRLTKSAHMGVFEEIKILQSQLGITKADFISGIAAETRVYCGNR